MANFEPDTVIKEVEEIELDSGAVYDVRWDDSCVVVDNLVWLEPAVLPKLIEYAERKQKEQDENIKEEQT